MNALMAIVARGAFELQSQSALSLEEIAALQAGI
jgi:hypothetical protein